MHPNTPLEHAVAENDALPHKKRRTNDEIAQEYDTSEASVRRARKRLKNGKNKQKSEKTALKVEGTTEELEFDNLVLSEPAHEGAFKAIFDLAGLSQSDYALKDGSLRFSTWQQTPDTQLYSYRGTFVRRNTEREALEADIIARIKAAPKQNSAAPKQTPATPAPTHILSLSDAQLGKTDSGRGTLDTVQCVKQATNHFANTLPNTPVPEIVLVDGGDIIENMFNTPSQPYTNDLDLAAQIRTARRLVIDTILTLEPLTDKLTYIAVPSNHGQVRASTGRNQAGTTEADFGLDIQEQVKDAIALSPQLQTKVNFVRPPNLEETAIYTTQDGTKLAVNHGHRTGGQNKVCDWWARQDHGRMPGWDADILLVAHYHTPYVRQSGDGRWVLGMASPEPGSQYFALSTGEKSTKGCTAFTTQAGAWGNYCIL